MLRRNAVLAVALGVERVFRVRREQLQRIALEHLAECGPSQDGSYLTIGGRSGSLKRLRLLHSNSSLPDWVCRPVADIPRVVRRQRLRLRHVLLAVLPEPAERHRRAQLLLLRRHDVIAALRRNSFHEITFGRSEASNRALDPVDLVDALGEVVGEAEPLADLVEDPVVGLRFAQRLDRRRLEDDDAVVELLLAVMAVAAEPRPFADVDALEIGAGRQDHVGELRLALEPDRLVDDEFEIRPTGTSAHGDWCCSWSRGSSRRTCRASSPANGRAPDRRTWRTGARSTCRPRDSPRPCRRRSPPASRCAGCAGRSMFMVGSCGMR